MFSKRKTQYLSVLKSQFLQKVFKFHVQRSKYFLNVFVSDCWLLLLDAYKLKAELFRQQIMLQETI